MLKIALMNRPAITCRVFAPDLITLWLVAFMALGQASTSARGQVPDADSLMSTRAPSIQLPDATVPRAKALSLDAALIKGWHLVDSGRDYAIFETPLDEPASAGPADAHRPEKTLLRIRADFSQSKGGVTAQLSATEIWRAGTERSWSTDITQTYRAHLERALASLSAQWLQFTRASVRSTPLQTDRRQLQLAEPIDNGGPASLDPDAVSKHRQDPRPFVPHAAQPQTATALQPAIRIGIWAFDAEQLARQQGCRLDEIGAILLSDKAAVELHRVGCIDRDAMLVRCNRQRCWMAH
ncbi:hypothetical protein CKO42_14065 [Lamprobacter modestohalophilus]|uniref:Uncharacterized protein n=2 Tax=Lamprobacter modestohalophilus TaxID=1064514 RepID=A0A9X0W9I9_9GAMM|nr:hypothetical protein [Lamprobacter modestohalophilus]